MMTRCKSLSCKFMSTALNLALFVQNYIMYYKVGVQPELSG